jgi:hypothetical protein
LKEEMPSVFGKDTKKKELIKNLDKIYDKIHRTHGISMGDFPNINKMREVLDQLDFRTFKSLDKKLIEKVDNMLASDITQLMQMIPKEETIKAQDEPSIKLRGGAFDDSEVTPFGHGQEEGVNAGAGEVDWIIDKLRGPHDAIFSTLNPSQGKISAASAKNELIKSKLPNSVLAKVWKLSDVDKDGMLDSDEFALANYLIKLKLDGHELPTSLPQHLIPPSKRKIYPSMTHNESSHSLRSAENNYEM